MHKMVLVILTVHVQPGYKHRSLEKPASSHPQPAQAIAMIVLPSPVRLDSFRKGKHSPGRQADAATTVALPPH